MSDEQAMHTPIPRIMLTLKGRTQWELMKAGVSPEEHEAPGAKIKASLLNFELQFKANRKAME